MFPGMNFYMSLIQSTIILRDFFLQVFDFMESDMLTLTFWIGSGSKILVPQCSPVMNLYMSNTNRHSAMPYFSGIRLNRIHDIDLDLKEWVKVKDLGTKLFPRYEFLYVHNTKYCSRRLHFGDI